MMNFNLSINLENLMWSSDWNGYEVGYPDVDVIGLYRQEREDGCYSFYIDVFKGEIVDFWKDDNEYDEIMEY